MEMMDLKLELISKIWTNPNRLRCFNVQIPAAIPDLFNDMWELKRDVHSLVTLKPDKMTKF